MVFITKTSEDCIITVYLDGLDATCFSLEVPEMVTVGVLDTAVVWTIFPVTDDKTNPSDD